MPETSKTVSNALSVLSCFSRSEPVLTASELARRLKLARTSVIRLLATLERFGYIEKKLCERDQTFDATTLDEMEALWQEAKESKQ